MIKPGQKFTISLVYFFVRDIDRAIAFYTNILCMPLKYRSGNNWAEVDAGSIRIGLSATTDSEPITQGGGTPSFFIKKIDKIVDQLRKQGVKVSKIYNAERGKFAIINDPDGNQLHMIEFSLRWLKKTAYPIS